MSNVFEIAKVYANMGNRSKAAPKGELNTDRYLDISEVDVGKRLAPEKVETNDALAMDDAYWCFRLLNTSQKNEAVDALKKNFKTLMKTKDSQSLFRSFLFRLKLITIAVQDPCDSDRTLMKILEGVYARLLDDADLIPAFINNLALSNDAKTTVEKAFQSLIDHGIQLLEQNNVIANLKLLLLSEHILFENHHSLFFKSLLESKWFQCMAVREHPEDPMVILRLIAVTIASGNCCLIHGGSYILAMTKLMINWTIVRPATMIEYVRDQLSTNLQLEISKVDRIKAKLLEFFCSDEAAVYLPSMPDEEIRTIFDHVCNKMLTKRFLIDTASVLIYFTFDLHKKLLEGNSLIWSTERCANIVNILLKCILFSLFDFQDDNKKVLWQAIRVVDTIVQSRSNLDSKLMFQNIIVERVTSCSDESIIDAMPIENLLDLTLGKSEAIQSLLLRYFYMMGRRLYHACRRSNSSTVKILNGCEILLDRYFTDANCLTPAGILKYLGPIAQLLEGIACQCQSVRSERPTDSEMMAFGNAVHMALQLSLKTTAYAALSDDPECWPDVLDTARDKLIMSKMMSSQLPNYLGFNFVIREVEKSSALFEQKIRAANPLQSNRLYIALVSAFGEAIHKYDVTICERNGVNHEGVEKLLKNCLDKAWRIESAPLYMSHCNASYVKATFEYVFEFQRRNQYRISRSLSELPERFQQLREKSNTSRVICDPEFYETAATHQRKFETQIMLVLTAFNTKNISKEDLLMLDKDPCILDSFSTVASRWDLHSSELQDMRKESTKCLLDEFKTEEDEKDALAGVVSFLELRSLFPMVPALKLTIAIAVESNIKLIDLSAGNADVVAKLNLDEFTLDALKTFSRGSQMFASRFDAHMESVVRDANKEDQNIRTITSKTKGALDELRDLVSNTDVRIDDFKITLTEVIAEMQSRRRSTMTAELERIAIFFAKKIVGGIDGDMNLGRSAAASRNIGDTIKANLDAAFSLLRYRDILLPFRTALIDMELLPRDVIEFLNDSAALTELQTNFYVAQAPRLLGEVVTSLEGISVPALELVGKLVDADLLMQFLKKRGQSFESDLDRAQQRYSWDEFSSRVLTHLTGMNALLEPFYSLSLHTLSDMKAHLETNVRMSPDGKDCLTAAYLANVCENWTAVEMCFRDGGDTNAGTEDIQRSITMYQKTGQFVSSLAAHPGGSSLSFMYVQQGGIRISLPPDQLQTHVQWAVLGRDVAILEEFVSAFGKAQCAHAVCLKLEDEGHPDHQAISPPAPLSLTCRIQDISKAVENLNDQLREWREMSSRLCEKYPRLLLLNRRSRVQLLLKLRKVSISSCMDLLPHVLQCFPTLLNERDLFEKALLDSLKVLIIQRQQLKDLACAGELISLVETNLEKCDRIRALMSVANDDSNHATRLELQGSSATEIYCQHLSTFICQSTGLGMPGMVLWSRSSTTERAVQDLLLVASTPGLTAAVHVVGVDRLTPRIREVLLRGIERTTLRCPLLLIFGDRDGADTFAQYESEGDVQVRKPADVRASLWASFASSTSNHNAEVWVVAGKSGMGKSHWIVENLKAEKLQDTCLHFVVHEGFSVKNVIKRLEELIRKLSKKKSKDAAVALCFNVTDLACFDSLSQFLHHLLALGLIIDEESGESLAIPPNTPLRVYIELPQIFSQDAAASCWPPADDDSKWTASKHPLLNLLPVLVVAVTHDHFISVRESDAFVIDAQAQYVATYLHLARDPETFDSTRLPNTENLLANNHCQPILEKELFQKFDVSNSKRVRSFTIKLLYDRCLYLRNIDEHLTRSAEIRDEEYMQSALEVRLEGSFHKVFHLFIREALDIASDAKCLPETSVFTIRPTRLDEFEVLVATLNCDSANYRHLSSQFMESKKLIIRDGAIPAEIRANVAPAFGIDDTSSLVTTLEDCGHLLTPESLVRILHMHSRRLLGASVIYEGETGVGKSQNLKLYSLLINANNSVFTNLKLHLVAVVRAVAQNRHQAAKGAAEGDLGEGDATYSLAHICSSSSIEKILDVVKAWVRIDMDIRTSEMGAAVCEYFNRLFASYPLHREGFQRSSVAAYMTMEQYKQSAFRNPDDPTVKLALEMTCSAEKADFLMLRPTAVCNSTVDSIDQSANSPTSFETVAADATADNRTNLEPIFKTYNQLADLMNRLVSSPPFSLYHRILADEGLTPLKWRTFLDTIIAASIRVQQLSADTIICVFVDELNTAGCLGMVTEAFLSHSLDGIPLPPNIFFVGAINPLRGSSAPKGTMDFTKSEIGTPDDDGDSDYLSKAPYIVRPLSPSMESLKVWYPNLDERAERSFIFEHLRLHLSVPKPDSIKSIAWDEITAQFTIRAAEAIVRAQGLVRSYQVPRVFMSIRNLIRCSHLLSWLINFNVPTDRDLHGFAFNYCNIFLPFNKALPIAQTEKRTRNKMDQAGPDLFETKDRMQSALVMAITVTYWFQLPSHGHILAGKATEDLRVRFIRNITQDQNQSVSENKWKTIIADSLTNLFSFAQIPSGIAHTTALKENFYCVILASINKIPLLITGPPGCGKTLSFLLACDALKGNCPQHTVAFQHLPKAKKITYQCSVASTGAEIAAVCCGAHVKQEHLESQQPKRNICLLGIDEAGLTPENRQALKSLHDFLDMREIGTVMMSNTTLDAAKTSRTIQLLQTQANMEDLWELAWGIIAAEDAHSASAQMLPVWKKQVRGLCEAFQTVGTVILRNNWFHSRDFIFLCRLLRIRAVDKGTPFDSILLLSALRRHFQPSEPVMFPALARHFLEKCNLRSPEGDELDARVVRSLRESLSDSLVDGTDPTSAHCRYTLVVDPTDCEAAVDLLFALKLLDRRLTEVVSLSNFPEDASPTMTTAALAQIMKCIEEGKTLLLVNSSPLQSALYDVINRHYAVSVREDGRKEAYANIPLGSFSSLIRVHESFRLIVHIPTSELCKTPMPFLNRLEKYTLSVRDALSQRIVEVSQKPPHCLRSMSKVEHRERIFREMEAGVSDFVAFTGGSTSFYGMSGTETVPALILRALEDACRSSNTEFEPRPSVLAAMAHADELRREEEKLMLRRSGEFVFSDSSQLVPEDVQEEYCQVGLATKGDEMIQEGSISNASSLVEMEVDGTEFQSAIRLDNLSLSGVGVNSDAKESCIRELCSVDMDLDFSIEFPGDSDPHHKPGQRFNVSATGSYDPASTRLRDFIRALNFQVMETARVESIFRLRSRLPAVYMREYLENQEHLSVESLLQQLVRLSPRYNATPGLKSEKLVIYTRTDSHILRMVTDSAYAGRIFRHSGTDCPVSSAATATATASVSFDNSNDNEYDTIIVSSVDTAPASSSLSVICIVPLAAFLSSADCARTLRSCMCPDGGRRMLIVVADMKQIAANQVTFARHIVDECMTRCAAHQMEGQSEETDFQVLPRIIFLLHVPADQLHLRPCYQTIPLNGWSAIYVDAFAFSDDLADADGSGAEDNASSNIFDSVREVERGTDNFKSSIITAKHSPKWMRVAFSLDSAPSLIDLRREFAHLAPHSLAQAVQMIDFDQKSMRGASKRYKQRFSDAGIIISLQAYEAGDKDWVLDMLRSRRYIMETLTDSFSALWGQLLQDTVEENCKRLAMGCTSRGLIASVRASHKWLLSDFMRTIVKRDLAADWALEALATLPQDPPQQATSKSSNCIDEETINAIGALSEDNSNDFVPKLDDDNSVESDAVKLTVFLLKGIIAIRSDDHLKQHMTISSIINRVDCKSCVAAPRIPLYQSLFTLLERLVPQLHQRSHRRRPRDSLISKIDSNAAALRVALFDCKLYKDIAMAVDIIERQPGLLTAWKRDFIAVTLEYAGRGLGHSEKELATLSLVALTLPSLAGAGQGDVCRWLLLKEELQAHLSGPSRLLVATRGILLEEDIHDILDRAIQGMTDTSPTEYENMKDDENIADNKYILHQSAIFQESGDINSLILPRIKHLSVQRLWTFMFNRYVSNMGYTLSNGDREHPRDLQSWMRCMRDLQEIEGFDIESLLSTVGTKVLNLTQSFMFCIMTIVSKIIAATGLSLEHFTALADINQNSISDLLCIALALLSNAAAELNKKAADNPFSAYATSNSSFEIMSHSVTTCLKWLFRAPVAISSSTSKRLLLRGLLGLNALPGGQMPVSDEEDILTMISALPLSARSHFLNLLLQVDESAEQQMSIIVDSAATDLDRAKPLTYIPETAFVVATPHPALDAFHSRMPNNKNLHRGSAGQNTGGKIRVDTLIYRTLHLSHLKESETCDINQAAEEYTKAANLVNDLNGQVKYLPHIILASRIIILLDSAAEHLSEGGFTATLLHNEAPITTAIRAALQTAPGIWTLYLLSRLGDIGKVTRMLHSKQLLEIFGIDWLYCEAFELADAMVLPAEIEERTRVGDRLEAILVAVTIATALVSYAIQQLELHMGSPVAAIIKAAGNDMQNKTKYICPLQRAAMEFVRMIATPEMSRALRMNAHIPILAAMHTFLTNHLAYRLMDISIARTLLVVDAIDKLPLEDRLVGRKLFRDFLDAWESLRGEFISFDVCGREVQAAREIPQLSSKSTYVSMLVEMGGTDVHESMSAMMLETRLLKLTSEVLSNPAVVNLRASVSFNRYQYLAEDPRSESISCLSMNSPLQLLVTGPIGAPSLRDDEYLNHTIACYSTWKPTSGPPLLPSCTDSARVSDTATLLDVKYQMARNNQLSAHEMSLILCPRCNNKFLRAGGCEHVTCGNHADPYAGKKNLPVVAAGTCGMQLDANIHRVPAPVHGKPLIGCFVLEVESQHLPVSLMGLNAPRVPDVPLSTGYYEFNWLAIASSMLSTLMRGRLDIKTSDGFFAPLNFANNTDESNDPQDSHFGGVREGAFLIGVGNVYARLHLAADEVTESLANISRTSAFKFSQETELSGLERSRIHNLANKQDEGQMENLCEQALALCIGVLRLISQGYFDELAERTSLELPNDYLAKTYIGKISLAPGMKTWSPELRSLLDFPLSRQFAVLKCMAKVGTEGVACGYLSLCVDMPEDDKKRLQSIQDELVESVKAGNCDVPLTTSELQTISFQLTDSLDSLLNDKGDKQLIKVTAVDKYLREHKNVLANAILPKLKVKHYGEVVRFLRQTLGLIAYHNLQAVQLTYNVKKPIEDDNGAISCTSESLVRTGSDTDVSLLSVYREIVPADWEAVQNTPDAIAYPELTVSAPTLLIENEFHLREKERSREQSSDIDDDWMISSSTICEDELLTKATTQSEDEVENLEKKGTYKASLDYLGAWQILSKPNSAFVPSDLSQALENLGADDADSLQYLDEEDMLTLCALLKKVPERKLRSMFGL